MWAIVCGVSVLGFGVAAARAQVPGDCNGNGVPDPNDIASGFSTDCDGNGVPDECDIAAWEYSIQDGSSEASVGASGGGDFIWFSRFRVIGGNEYVTAIDVAWGRLPAGVEATLAIWSDPNDDGNPYDAVLELAYGPVLTSSPDSDQFITFDVPDTFVGNDGESFYIGVYLSHGSTHSPAALDLDSGIPSDSWFAIGNNLSDLAANPTPPERIDSYGFNGNWLLRCHTANRDCNGNGWFDTCDISDGTSRDYDSDGIPDECQDQFQAAVELETTQQCLGIGAELEVTVRLIAAGQPIDAGDFRLSYDPDTLDFVRADPGDPNGVDPNNPFETETIEQVDEPNGLIEYAVSVPAGQEGTADPVAMAVLRFVTLSEACDAPALVAFRPAPDDTQLTGASGAPMFVQTADLPALTIDATPPTLEAPPDQTVYVQEGVCGASLELAAAAEDNCTAAEDVVLTWARSDGKTTLLDSFDAANSPIEVSWQASDQCGLTSSAVTVIDVRMLADLNDDLLVDLSDLAILLANYGLTSGAGYAEGDLEGDGDVDLGDLAIMLAEYGADCN